MIYSCARGWTGHKLKPQTSLPLQVALLHSGLGPWLMEYMSSLHSHYLAGCQVCSQHTKHTHVGFNTGYWKQERNRPLRDTVELGRSWQEGWIRRETFQKAEVRKSESLGQRRVQEILGRAADAAPPGNGTWTWADKCNQELNPKTGESAHLALCGSW